MRESINHLKNIIKYSDNDLLELLVGFIRIFLFPYLLVTSLFLPWWLMPVSFLVGLYQIFAVSRKSVQCRHKANFVSFVTSLLICIIISREYDSLFHYHFVVCFTVWLITVVNLLKTNFQIIKGAKICK